MLILERIWRRRQGGGGRGLSGSAGRLGVWIVVLVVHVNKTPGVAKGMYGLLDCEARRLITLWPRVISIAGPVDVHETNG